MLLWIRISSTLGRQHFEKSSDKMARPRFIPLLCGSSPETRNNQVFTFNFLAIIPLAWLIGKSTEDLFQWRGLWMSICRVKTLTETLQNKGELGINPLKTTFTGSFQIILQCVATFSQISGTIFCCLV